MKHLSFGIFLVLGTFLVVGCGGGDGPDTASVSGTVTLDGDPLPNANVVFLPTDLGAGLRMVSATTNSSGYYRLEYSSNQSGIQPGEYKVSISTAGTDSEGNSVPEKVPVAYNSRSDLMRTVPQGGETFDFELKSTEDEIVQPEEQY